MQQMAAQYGFTLRTTMGKANDIALSIFDRR
jgi:hypothetical protein